MDCTATCVCANREHGYGYAAERLWMTSMCPIRIANPQRFRRGSDNRIQWVTFIYVYAIIFWIRGGFGFL
jgi:hypothetical protein